MTILWLIIGLILVVGIIRVCAEPYTSFLNLLGQLTLIDWLIDILGEVIENILTDDN